MMKYERVLMLVFVFESFVFWKRSKFSKTKRVVYFEMCAEP